MHRRHLHQPAAPILAAVLPVALAAAWLLAALHPSPPPGRVYTVAAILEAASRNPAAWDGKVVRVRGVIQPGLVLLGGDSRLLSAAPATPAPGYMPLADTLSTLTVLWVTGRRERGLQALLHRIPVADAVAPGPRLVDIATMTIYRVQLHSDPARCPSPTCIVGTLPDYATPAIDPFGLAGGPSAHAGQ